MAQIAVERKGGIPWWVWLIAVLIIIGIIAYFATANNNNQAVVAPGSTGEAARTAIVDPLVLYNPADPTVLAGNRVELAPVKVLSVAGNNAYWVGESANRDFLLVLGPQIQQTTLAPGEVVRIYGTAERFPGYERASQMWNLNANDRAAFNRQTVYVNADRIDVTNRP